MMTKTKATLADLYRVPEDGKAELVNGELILIPPTGGLPGYAGGEIFASLRDHARRTRAGVAFSNTLRLAVEGTTRHSHLSSTGHEQYMEIPQPRHWGKIRYNQGMSVQEIKAAITQLPDSELASLAAWFEEYQANLWDQQIESDALAGRLDALGEQADREFEAGRCHPL